MNLKRIIKCFLPFIDIDEKIYYLYKIAHYFSNNVHLKNYFSYRIMKKYNCCISPCAIIEEKVKLPHPIGIVIGEGVKIGKNVTIYQNVTLGRKKNNIINYPVVGDNVIIYCNAVILGNVKIGNGAVIGANSIVLRDVKENETVYGVVK